MGAREQGELKGGGTSEATCPGYRINQAPHASKSLRRQQRLIEEIGEALEQRQQLRQEMSMREFATLQRSEEYEEQRLLHIEELKQARIRQEILVKASRRTPRVDSDVLM